MLKFKVYHVYRPVINIDSSHKLYKWLPLENAYTKQDESLKKTDCKVVSMEFSWGDMWFGAVFSKT